MKLRFVSYNIHKCIGGLDRRYSPERVRDAICHYEPDFVLLQEVDEGARRSNGHRQVDVLGDLLNLRHRTFFPNVRVAGGGHYGNAILSRFPLTETRNIDVSIRWTKKRSVLHARFRVRRQGHGHDPWFRTVHVYNLHLGLSQILRKLQLQKFLASHPFSSHHPRTPIILAGDFNDVWGNIGCDLLAPAGFACPPELIRTFPAYAPLRALDSVFVRGDVKLLDLRRASTPASRWASDHLPLVADVDVG
jgi:endonuclease/exonuclease/phosphatase family metal-dependent hydrolase